MSQDSKPRGFFIDEDTAQFLFKLFGYAGEAMSRAREAERQGRSKEEPPEPVSASRGEAPGSDAGAAAAEPASKLFAVLEHVAQGEAAVPPEPFPAKSPYSREVRPERVRKAAEDELRARATELSYGPAARSSPFSSPKDPAWSLWRQAMVLAEDEIDEEARRLMRWLEVESTPPPDEEGAAKPRSGKG